MIKKLLKSIIIRTFSYNNEKDKIENYLSQSKNSYDLENRIKELEKSGKYNIFY